MKHKGFVCLFHFVVLIQFINYFFLDHFFEVASKSHQQAQGHLVFLCCLPGILQFFVLYLDLLSFTVNVCKRCGPHEKLMVPIPFIDISLYGTMSGLSVLFQ